MSFSVMLNSYFGIFFITIENFYLIEKEIKEKFVKKIVDSEIMKTCDELHLKLGHSSVSKE